MSNITEMYGFLLIPLPILDKEMNQLTANTTDAAKEKHMPVIERNGIKVKVKIRQK